MNNKIYVLTVLRTQDYYTTCEVKLFETLESGIKQFELLISSIINDFLERYSNTDDFITEDYIAGDTSWSICQSGFPLSDAVKLELSSVELVK